MRIFHGWFVLGGVFVIYAVSNGTANFTLPLFYPSLRDEFGWTQEEVTRPAAIKFLFASLYSLLIGYLIDRFPARPIMTIGALLMVSGFVFFTFISNLYHLTFVVLLLGFGMSWCGLLPCMVITSRWFNVFRGRAVGILLMASSLGGVIFPLVVSGSLETGDWRRGAFLMAGAAAIFMVLPFIWPIRDTPEEMDEKPDGRNTKLNEKQEAKASTIGYASGTTLSQAARMPEFYFLLIATGTLWFCISAVVQHQALYLGQDQGLPMDQLSWVFSLFFASSIFGKFAFGWLSDHVQKVNVMILAIVNLIVGLTILRFVEGASKEVIYIYAVVYGIGFSGSFTMVQLMVAELFAGVTYGSILGVFLAVDTLLSGVGIFLLGKIRVVTGSYIPAIDMMLVMCICAFACVVCLKHLMAKPKHQGSS